MSSIIIYKDVEYLLDIEANTDFETLKYLSISIIDSLTFDELYFLDYCGREIKNDHDMLQLLSNYHTPRGNDDVISIKLWCVDLNSTILFQSLCSKNVFPETLLIQPGYQFIDTDFYFCRYCKMFTDSSLIMPHTSVTSAVKSFICDYSKAVEIGLCMPIVESNQSLKKIPTENEIKGPLGYYLKRQYYKEAILMQNPSTISTSLALNAESRQFEMSVKHGCQHMNDYTNISNQQKAREVINFTKIYEYSTAYYTTQNQNDGNQRVNKDIAFLYGLLQWFKVDFFQWCNKPACENPECCARPGEMESIGGANPTIQEVSEGSAGRVEVYKCTLCRQITRFPRYNNPVHLLKTRKGRCGEWANCFCLICMSLGLDAKYVHDSTDHVWVEVWINSLNRFAHLDPCERGLDAPMTYEVGWNKKLKHITSFSRYSVNDTISRYSRKLEEVLPRRSMEIPEFYAQTIVSKYDHEMKNKYINNYANNITINEQTSTPTNNTNATSYHQLCTSTDVHYDNLSLHNNITCQTAYEQLANLGLTISDMNYRREKEVSDLYGMTFLSVKDVKLEELKGRISGDIAWRLERGEIDQSDDNLDINTSSNMNSTKNSKLYKFGYKPNEKLADWIVPGTSNSI